MEFQIRKSDGLIVGVAQEEPGIVGVWTEDRAHGVLVNISPAQARELADELRKMADRAEGKG